MMGTAVKPAIFCLLLVNMFFAGCGVMMPQTDSVQEEEIPYLDPFSFGDEFSKTGASPADNQDSGIQENAEIAGTGPDAGVRSSIQSNQQSQALYVFRIHLGVFNTREDADRMAEYARSRLDVSVYMVYEPPFYRVRAGDFRTREDATDYVNYMKSIDRRFNNAYPLQSPINTP